MKNFTLKLLLCIAAALPATAMSQAPRLSSFPSASATLYLDFDGHFVQCAYWNGGNAFTCQPAAFTNEQITEMFHRVAEDFRPFDINITTDSAKFIAAPLNKRMRIVVTPTSSWYGGNVGGVSYVGSFTWGDNTPGFVFADKLGNNPKFVAECISHESGHTVGLSHQSRYDNNCSMTEQYNVGTGAGETSWAPVMGNSYYRNMTGWNDGPTPYGCANTQDNLTIITSINGFSYRADDFKDEINASTYSLGSSSFNVDGVISRTGDKDAFKYTLTGNVRFFLKAQPFSIGNNTGANLDIEIDMYKDDQLIRSFNPANSLSVDIDTSLTAGTYYFVVSGAGNENTNNYGSLGSYNMLGFFGILAIKNISLAGEVKQGQHSLHWNVVCDEPVRAQEIEISKDGINFKPLATINTNQKTFLYAANQNTTTYYRLKVTSVQDQTAYSNVIALKSNVAAADFTVSTLVQQDITVNATEHFQYRLYDANGRAIFQGNGVKGFNKINVGNQAGGMYILQLLTDNKRQTERIIKQ